MSQLKLFKGRRLARPVGVDWFRQLRGDKLLNLRVGNFIWFVQDEWIECAEITQPSAQLDIMSDPAMRGIQVFWSSLHRIRTPDLLLDGQKSGLHMIIDREAAYEYYAIQAASDEASEGLKLVVNNKG